MQNTEISTTFQTIQNRIVLAEAQYHRLPGSVQLLAVSKKQSDTKVRALAQIGQRDFAESYVQEALKKMQLLSDLALIWHFIGPIQSNKTKLIAENFHWVHSVDRLSIAERFSRQRPTSLPPLKICIQANISEESTKSGFSPSQVLEAAQAVAQLPRLTFCGLMVIPEKCLEFEQQRIAFRRAEQLFQAMKAVISGVTTLSMGMSADLEAAIAEQSTCVRIGTALFGRRDV